MNIQTFWNLIEIAKVQSNNDLNLQVKILVDTLAQRSEDEIIAFDRLFGLYETIVFLALEDDCAEVFGIGDSSFKDFIGWLIAQGRKVYWDAFYDLDTLADVEQQDDGIYLELMLYAAHYAYKRKTSQDLPWTTVLFRTASPRPYRKREQLTEEMTAQKYPKLTAKLTAYRRIEEKYDALLGQTAWGVRLGKGSFLTIEFGKSLPPQFTKRGREVIHGEWHLWVYEARWSLLKDRKILLRSEDEREKIEQTIGDLEGAVLQTMYTIVPELDTSLTFDNGVTLHLEPTDTRDVIHWMLFTPEKKVLTIGPGKDWSYEDE